MISGGWQCADLELTVLADCTGWQVHLELESQENEGSKESVLKLKLFSPEVTSANIQHTHIIYGHEVASENTQHTYIIYNHEVAFANIYHTCTINQSAALTVQTLLLPPGFHPADSVE